MGKGFVHLRLHSEFSLRDGLVRIKPLMKRLIEKKMNAVALTDFCNLFAAVKMYKAAIAAGIKPLLGAELTCWDERRPEQNDNLLLLCQNELGYRHLTALISRAYEEGQYQGQPRINYAWLPSYTEGLIALSGAQSGAIGKALLAEDEAAAQEWAAFFMKLFPQRFYLEIQKLGQERESFYLSKVSALAQELNLPLVATNQVCFLEREDFEAHEARVCIHLGTTLEDPKRPRNYQPGQYLRSPEEMVELFKDYPEAIENTLEIAKRCNLFLPLGENFLPHFPLPEGETAESYLSALSFEGLKQRLNTLFPDEEQAQLEARALPFIARLENELQVINAMGFAGYFLIVADFIQWARKNEVPVGPGRGSGAGSLVAYVLEITDLNPLAFDLLFERFLNPERVSMPDFDVDFCMEGRDRVIDYVAEKYGRQSVCQIITFGTMAAKAVIRDVGRILSYPYGFVDKLAKLIPFEIGITLNKALAQVEELQRRYDTEDEVKELFDLALKLEGITRNAGKHAGGVVIAPSKLTDFMPIYCEENGAARVSQFDKDDVEAVGLVKFDFLGLRTLTIIHRAVQIINQQSIQEKKPLIDIRTISTHDPKTYESLKACKITAVFQLEKSRGMKELIHRLQPDSLEDIIALVALFRPGPLQSGMVDDFINRKHGRAKVAYPHSDLEAVLKPTYGVILYQEQVMQIAQVLANYTLGAADLLRRAMGKKKPEEMAKQRLTFVEGAVARGVQEEVASLIFDLMEKFAGYGFNKSHSAAYGLLSYQTAWLKVHHPAAFMAAVLSADMDNTDKIMILIHECQEMQLKILSPAINASNFEFTVAHTQAILFGLGAIKGVGEAAIDCILVERKKKGPFKSLFDFCQRLDLRKVNRRVLEALIKSGALDEWGKERAVLHASLDKALKLAEMHQKNNLSGQFDLFSLFDESVGDEAYQFAPTWSESLRLNYEKETLGFYFSGHPARSFCEEFKIKISTMLHLQRTLPRRAWACGLVLQVRRIITKSNKKMLILQLEDYTGQMTVIIFEEQQAKEQVIQSGQCILVEGDLSTDSFDGGIKMKANQVLSIMEARAAFAKHLHLALAPKHQVAFSHLKEILQQHPGACPVKINYSNMQAQALLALPSSWQVTINEDLLSSLKALLGEEEVMLAYC